MDIFLAMRVMMEIYLKDIEKQVLNPALSAPAAFFFFWTQDNYLEETSLSLHLIADILILIAFYEVYIYFIRCRLKGCLVIEKIVCGRNLGSISI